MPNRQLPADERPGSVSSDLTTSSPNFFRVPVPEQEAFTPTDNLSSLESDDQIIHEYARVVMPPMVPYEPIQIPREQTLEEILQQATESTELDQVRHLKLRVISDNVSLQRIAHYCPLLTSLTLEGSALNTLRELGCMMTSLRFLNVSRCGLRNLDGTSGLCSVTHLLANNNRIEYLDPCSYLDELEELSVQGNRIQTTYNLRCLSLCPKLRTVHLNGNPIEEENQNLDELAKRIIPHLIFINGIRLREEDVVPGRCNDDSLSSHPSTSSGSFSSMDKSLDLLNIKSATAEGGVVTGAAFITPSSASSPGPSTTRRPLSADALGVSRDRPLSGSLLRLREKRRSAAAWGSPNKIHSLEEEEPEEDGSCFFPPILDKQFPPRLPQTPVELELGVVGSLVERSQSVFASFSDAQKLLSMAEQWRKNFRKRKLARPASSKGRLPGYEVISLLSAATIKDDDD